MFFAKTIYKIARAKPNTSPILVAIAAPKDFKFNPMTNNASNPILKAIATEKKTNGMKELPSPLSIADTLIYPV